MADKSSKHVPLGPARGQEVGSEALAVVAAGALLVEPRDVSVRDEARARHGTPGGATPPPPKSGLQLYTRIQNEGGVCMR